MKKRFEALKRWKRLGAGLLAIAGAGLLSSCECMDEEDLYRSSYERPKVFCRDHYDDCRGSSWSGYRGGGTYRSYPIYVEKAYIRVYNGPCRGYR